MENEQNPAWYIVHPGAWFWLVFADIQVEASIVVVEFSFKCMCLFGIRKGTFRVTSPYHEVIENVQLVLTLFVEMCTPKIVNVGLHACNMTMMHLAKHYVYAYLTCWPAQLKQCEAVIE